MRHEIPMNESVIYALRMEDRILREFRELDGGRQNSILGGSIESIDHEQDDFVVAAVHREASEELGVEPTHCSQLGDFVSSGVRYYVVLVDAWTGTVPDTNRDNGNELRWVSSETLVDGISLEPLRRIIAATTFPAAAYAKRFQTCHPDRSEAKWKDL